MGILARPAEAMQLLIEHQHDLGASDQPTEPEPADPTEPHDHRSLSMRLPTSFDAKAARPKVVLHFHLTDHALQQGGVVRPEHGEPVTINQLTEFLAAAGCQVRVQPVLDPASTAPIDWYEVSPRLRAAVRYRQVADVFPFGTCISPSMDLDHTQPYRSMDYGGPPGQTRLGNLGPMARSSHRTVTTAAGASPSRSPATSCTAHRRAMSTW